MTPEQRDAIIELALTPQLIRFQFFCRLCGAVTSSRETQESAGTHRVECPKRAALTVTP